ncbi:hypothetical protein [Microtetraspora malaysiensis]|uniref:hypothetical protein n=1 Tax=Microtetraspora malaysiensis TaxID=161358 RepID=UPI003D8FF3CA
MDLFSAVVGVAALSGTIFFAGVGQADAPGGEVVVFTTELEGLVKYPDPPAGSCLRLPPAAHVLINLTRSRVSIHATPSCLGPGIPVEPDHGRHAPPSGQFSFSVA